MVEQPGEARGGAPGSGYPATARGILKLENNNIVVENEDGSGELLRVRAGGTVTWDCPSDSPLKWWAVVLKEETPFDDGAGSTGNNRGTPQGKKIRHDANGGSTRRYAYAVVASDGKKVFFLDPEIEVGPTGGG